MAADPCSTPPGRLFITDQVSNLRFLVDTGSDLCVFPRRLVPGRRERNQLRSLRSQRYTHPDLRMAHPHAQPRASTGLHLAFPGGRRPNPNHRVDLLANFSLLVDCRNNRILDGIASLSAPAQTASTRFPSVKAIGSSTPTDDIFAEFPELTRPSGVQRTVRHNTVHHIKTTPGPPVSC
jgi:hypothetical protein